MKHFKTSTRRQKGFTLPEILAVIALIGVLLSTVVTNFGSASTELAMVSSKDTLLNDMPAAMLSYRSIYGGLSGLRKEFLVSAGLSNEGPFGDIWTLGTTTARTAIVQWELDSAADPADFGQKLTVALTNAGVGTSAISALEYNATGKYVKLTYLIP